MIDRLAGRTLRWLLARRRQAFEQVWRDPSSVQERALLRLIGAARDTEFGLAHGFHAIRSVADYQARVPLREYVDFRPLWERAFGGARDVTWPGRARHWARTSGTTGRAKLIPVSREAMASHRRGGRDAFLLAVERAGAEHLLGGPTLFLGGATCLQPVGAGCLAGDLSGLALRRLPPVIRGRYSPGAATSAIPDGETRMETVARLAAQQDIRLLAGVPPSILILFERAARARAEAGRPVRDMGHCWPNLRTLIHGGVSFMPYASAFEEWLGCRLERIEVYPAAEGFVAMQTETKGDLTLMLDYDIFYEFIPVEDLASPRPRRHTVADVELERPYALALTTAAGLWSYLLGDTVRFTGRDPLRLVITGRIPHFVDAFGENVIVEEVERALVGACRRTQAEAVEFTLAPRYPSAFEPRGGHDFLVEFRVPPTEPEEFVRILDETLCAVNHHYRTKRGRAVGMAVPRVIALAPGTVHEWMRRTGRLGHGHKMPRVTNDRHVAEELLAVAGPLGGAAPLVSPASSEALAVW